jgi:hypothetical protein
VVEQVLCVKMNGTDNGGGGDDLWEENHGENFPSSY